MRAVLGRLFGEGFRIFFLCAGVFGVLAMLAWEVWLGLHAAGRMVSAPPFDQAPHHWHAHEMIFGYGGAALGGFFLTAVPSWTGAAAARHVFISAAAGLWLAGRGAMWLSAACPPLLVAGLDLAFLPLLAVKIALQLAKRPKPQNLMFLGLLLLLWASNLATHLDWVGLGGPGADAGLRAGLLSLIAIIAVLGGRITPAFTRNAMTKAGRQTGLPASFRPLEALALSATILLPVLLLAGVAESVTGVVALVAGAAQLLRLAGWRCLWTLSQPILWSMHLAFAMLALGLIALGLADLDMGSEVGALHLLGIGAVGGMTLAVMSRAILGHTSQPLVAPRPVAAGYALMAAAALARWLGSWLGLKAYWAAVLLSGTAWIAALTLFVIVFLPALLGPRARP